MKMLVVAFIIGLITVVTLCVGDFYYEAQEYDGVYTDSVEVPVVDVNIYDFKK